MKERRAFDTEVGITMQHQQFTYAPYLSQRQGLMQTERANFISVLVIATCFGVSLLAKLFESGTVANGIQGGTMVFLIIYTYGCKKRFSLRTIPRNMKIAIGLILTATFFLGVIGYLITAPRELRMNVLFKSVGTLLTLTALILAAPAFTQKEISRGLQLFALFEGMGCLALYLSGTDINANALAVRMSVSAMVLMTLSKHRFVQIASFAMCMGFSISLQCRTSLCAFLGAVVFMYVERHSRRNRALILASTIIGSILLWLVLPFLLSSVKQLAISNLGSDNFVARFFLSDKNVAKIDVDMLDRSHVWEYSWSLIKEKPWLGYGFGTENAIMGARSHNAYLGMLFEGGALNCFCWCWFYYLSLTRFFNRNWVDKTGEIPLYFLCNLLFGYMLLAGLVENSGLASISTPINLIFIFLVVYLFSPKAYADPTG